MDGGAGAPPTVRKRTPARERVPVSSRADANAAPLERDDVPELQLPPAPPIDLAVHGHVAIDDGLFHVPTGVEEAREFEELAEADAVAADRDVVDRGGVGHAEMLADVRASGWLVIASTPVEAHARRMVPWKDSKTATTAQAPSRDAEISEIPRFLKARR